jgi:hypothetical protein
MHGKDLIMSQVASTSKQQSSGVVWVALLVIVSIIGGAYVMHQNTANNSATPSHPSSKTTQQVLPTGSGHSLYGPSSLSVTQINAILLAYHSPAQGQGQMLVDLSAQFGIDDAYPLAFFMHESTLGTVGMANLTHSLGNLRCIDGAGCVNSQGGICQAGQSCYAYFPTWQAGFHAWFVLITSSLYKGDGLTTVESIIPRYAPSGDHNNEGAYIESLVYCVQSWQAGKVVLS